MSGFLIRRIAVTGPDVKDSEVLFEPGVNIIHGDPNTGKSVVVNCIEYMFSGSDIPLIALASGYDTVSMTLEGDDGQTLDISRSMELSEKGPKAGSSMVVESHMAGVENGRYSNNHDAKSAYNNLLLKLLGSENAFKIIGAKNRTGKMLTVKSFVHQFLLDKSRMELEASILINPGENYSNDTYNINALIYLLTGEYEAPDQVETPKTKEIKKKAVIDYIKTARSAIAERKQELQDELDNIGDVDPDKQIDAILEETANLESLINSASEKATEAASKIMRLSQRLEESRIQKERYSRLQSLYDADIKRLNFILDGENKLPEESQGRCPFCDGEIREEQRPPDYYEATRAELDKTRQRIYGLVDAQTDTDEEIVALETELDRLKEQNRQYTTAINEHYAPRMKRLKDVLVSCERVIQLRQELEAQSKMLAAVDADLNDTKNIITKVEEFDAKAFFDSRLFELLSSDVADAIKACGYPDFKSARISRETFDVVVNGKPKIMEGEGRKAYLNSIFAFTLMKFIEANGMYPPRLLLLESPILALKESREASISVAMKTKMFEYFLKECGDSQLIIVENQLPDGVDYSNANVIEFTGTEGVGRYGFLAETHDFSNDEDAEKIWREREDDEGDQLQQTLETPDRQELE